MTSILLAVIMILGCFVLEVGWGVTTITKTLAMIWGILCGLLIIHFHTKDKRKKR